jgi:hypothetical protein
MGIPLLSQTTQPEGATTTDPLAQDVQNEVTTATAMESVPGLDSLGSILAGGFHPESVAVIVTPVTTALSRATDSIRGPLGGLVPWGTGSQAPGPAAAAAEITDRVAAAAPVVKGWADRIRERFAPSGPPAGPPGG